MIKQFEVGKSYYREIPSNPNFAVVEECKKMGTEPYRIFQICEVIKRTKHFLTLKEGEYPNEEIYRKKVKIEKEIEVCQVGYYSHEEIKADQPFRSTTYEFINQHSFINSCLDSSSRLH